MTDRLWVVGGEQRIGFRQPEEWNRFRAAVVTRVEDGRARRVLEYESPPEHCPDERPSILFKAATFAGDTAWLCTPTEVLECAVPSFAIRRVISLPCFNDLHHVTPGPDGTLFVTVTGLDAVAEITPEGELLRLVSVLGGDPWERFPRDVDFRKVPTTKPHRAHPNFVFFLDGRPWVTRFEQRDAVPLDRPTGGGAFRVEIQGVHDGHRQGDRLFFTTVDGRLVAFDVAGGGRRVIDLNGLGDSGEAEGGRVPLGWCRGLLPLGDRAWVGFTRLRFTKLRQNLSWLRQGLRQGFRPGRRHRRHRRLPTRITLYDLTRPARLAEVDLETAGMNAVFSIHPG